MDLLTMVLACSAFSDNSVASAMAEINSKNNPLVISGKPFSSEKKALDYVEQLKAQGTSFEIGLMQIPNRLLDNSPIPVSMKELLRPCKNMIVATQLLNQFKFTPECNGSTACALSMYKSGDPQTGLDYANQVIQYAQDHPVIPPPPLE